MLGAVVGDVPLVRAAADPVQVGVLLRLDRADDEQAGAQQRVDVHAAERAVVDDPAQPVAGGSVLDGKAQSFTEEQVQGLQGLADRAALRLERYLPRR